MRVLAFAFNKGRLRGKVSNFSVCLQLGKCFFGHVACLVMSLRRLSSKVTEEEVQKAAKEVGNARSSVHVLAVYHM